MRNTTFIDWLRQRIASRQRGKKSWRRQLVQRRLATAFETLEPRRLLAVDLGDAPDIGAGTGPGDYQTLSANGGPSHNIDVTQTTLFLGASVDGDSGMLQNLRANADDVDGALPDDEDGVLSPLELLGTVGAAPTIALLVTNTTGSAATLSGWIDYNADGIFDNATERAHVPIPDGATAIRFTLTFPIIPAGSAGNSYARFRLSTDVAAENATGAASDGEVEDFPFAITNVSDGMASTSVKIASGTGGPNLSGFDKFGDSVTSLGDLDGDGVNDLAVGASNDNADGFSRGAVHIVLMNSDGRAKSSARIASGAGGGPVLTDQAHFGSSVASLSDLDGDGVNDLVVGALGDDTGGAVYVLLMNTDGTAKSNVKIASGTGGGPDLTNSGSFGASVTSLGDLDGDGVDDLAVGASGDNTSGDRRGAVYILLMSFDGTAKSSTKIASETGGGPMLADGDNFGSSVTSLGDLDGDGVNDLAVGAGFDNTGGHYRGAVYILLMNSDASVKSSVKIASETGGGPMLANEDGFGRSLASLGDLNGDGVNDLAVGAERDDTDGDDRGAVHVLLMKADGTAKSSVRIASGTGGGSILADGDLFGSAVAGAGDLDGDGVADLAVGARGDDTGGDYRGAAYVLLMNTDGTAKRSVNIANGENGGPALTDRDRFGSSLASLGDLDGDGVNDVVVGARGNDKYRGAVHVLLMNTDGTAKSSVKIASGIGGGPDLAADDRFGRSIASLGDLDGDGVNDLAVGAYGDDTGGVNRGAVHVLLMNSDGTVKSSVKIASGTGGGPNLANVSRFGVSVASLGDLDGDGVNDLAVGEDLDRDGANRGAVYVLLMNSDATAKRSVKIAPGTGGGPVSTDLKFFGSSVASLGDLDGDGVNDLAIGAYGDDTGGDSRGAVYVVLMNSDGTAKSNVKIASGTGGGPLLADRAAFGTSVASLGDMDGDGVDDLAVGAVSLSGGHGEVYMLLLNSDGTAKSSVKIADNPDFFGASVASLGDLDGDGVNELAIGAIFDDTGGLWRGAVYILLSSSTLDYGDAPDQAASGFNSDYPTTLAQDGARHTVGGLFLGARIDGESNGQPTAEADGDDNNGDADEDGVLATASIVATSASATTSSFVVTASDSGKVDAWIDFNQNGSWNDAGEQVFTSTNVAAGLNVLSFAIPAGAAAGETGVRFRISTVGGLAPTGIAADGEVEDYIATILNGDSNSGNDVEIGPPISGTLDVVADGNEVVVRSGAIELFRAPGSSLGRLNISGTDGNDTLNVANLNAIFSGSVRADAGKGDDTLRLTGGNQILDLTQITDSDIQGIETIDIAGSGDNSLTLDVNEVVSISPTTDTLRVVHDDRDAVNFGTGWAVEIPQIIAGQFVHVLKQTSATLEVANPTSFRNPFLPLDVNRDGKVAPIDALIIINRLNSTGPGSLATPTSVDGLTEFFYFDSNGDRAVAPIDALVVINFLNDPTGNKEGESSIFPVIPSLTASSGGSSIANTINKQRRQIGFSLSHEWVSSFGREKTSTLWCADRPGRKPYEQSKKSCS